MGGISFLSRALLVLIMGAALPAQAADKVGVGTVNNNSDAGFLIAAAKGYFAAEGLDVAFTLFDGAARMIAPLGTGQLDVGGGAASVGLYNAFAGGVAIKIVADRSRTEKNYNFQSLMVRKDLIESGKFKTYADLKGRKIATPVPGGSPISTVNEAAKKGGIAYGDIEKIFLGFPQQLTAFANGAIDAAIMVEPFATMVIKAGTALRFASTEDFYPSDQIGVMFYSEAFTRERRDAALRFTKAYVRALRDYNDAVLDGRFTDSAKGKEVVAILSAALKIAPEQIREAETQAVDPDGRVNAASMRKDFEFFKSLGEITNPALTLEQILDNSFVDEAAKALGPYKPAR